MDFTVRKDSLFQNALNKYVQNFPLRLPHFEIPLLVLVHIGEGEEGDDLEVVWENAEDEGDT
jgi:hypothetical protein